MGAQTRPLSRRQTHALHKWPCNGEVCWTVSGVRGEKPKTYSEAYEDIFVSTGGLFAEDGKRTFTHDGARRIANLNALYFPRAKDFIGSYYHQRQIERLAEQEKAKAAAAAAPAPDAQG